MTKKSTKILICLAFFMGLQFAAIGQTIKPTYLSVSDGVASSVVNAVIQDNSGNVSPTTENGIQNYDGYRFRSFRHETDNPNSLLHNMCWGITEDSNRNIWIGTDNGISRYDRKTNTFKNYPFNQSNPDIPGTGRTFFIAEDSHKRIWSAPTTIGFLQYDAQKDEWVPAQMQKDGAPMTDIKGIVLGLGEDRNAGIWVAIQNDGLYYCKPGSDIFEYVTVTTEDGVDFGTTEHSISATYVDSKNQLWLTTRNGVHRLDPASGVVKTFITYNYHPLLVWNNWNAIQEDADGNIWVANNFRGMLRFKDGGDTYEEIGIDGITWTKNNGLDITLTTFTIDKSGIFWFGTRGKGLMKYDPVEKPFTVYAHNPNDKTSISSNAVFGIAASAKDPERIYVGFRGAGLDVMDLRTKEFEHFSWKAKSDMFGGSARAVLEMGDGHVLVGTWGDGIIEFDAQMKEVQRINSDGSGQGLSSDKVRILKEDNLGQVWIGTDQGLNVWNRKTNIFQTIENRSTRRYPTVLFESVVRALSSPDSVSIQGVGDGASIARSFAVSEESTWLISNMGEGDTKNMYDYGWIENAAGDTIWSAFSGHVSYWAGGDVKNRMHLDAVTLKPGTYSLHYASDDSHSAGDGYNSSEPSHPEWWGIAVAPIRENSLIDKIKNFTPAEDNRMVISGSNIMDIALDNETAWVATALGGLNQLNMKTDEVKMYSHDPGLKNSISANAVNDLCTDREGMLWIGTENGLDKLNPKTGTITHYTREDGLPSNSILTIVAGNDGEMWVATTGGLSRLVSNSKLDKVTIINYFADDGTGGDIYMSPVGLRTADGTYFFGGEHGLTSFRSISGSQSPPDIMLSDFSISNKSVFDMGEASPLENALEYTDEITLSHDQNDLSFEFTALHYANPSKNQYAHKLEGFDADWVYDNRNFAAYTNLDPGTYTLHIRASNAYGVWNEEGKSIRITILSPWWRTWWAYAAYVVIFVLLLFVVDRAMRKRLALREQEKNRARELAQAKEIEKAYHKLEEAHEDLKSAQQQLVQQEKLASLGQLTAGIAHEIKNPLNFVNNFSELSIELIDEVTEEFRQGGFSGNKEEIETQLADIKANLLKICQHGTRADGIVKSMLQHSRGGNGKLESTDLNALISEFVNLAFHGMRAAKNPINVMLDFEYDESLGHVDLIAEDFSRVVLNLSNNAFDAMREKVQINPAYRPILSIRTIRNSETIAVSVSDNGSGIPDSIKDKILQPFFTTKKGTDGTGLGLSITHDIIKAHGGSLEISSENQEGSTFRITLPVK